MTAKMHQSTYHGKPCFAVTINGITHKFRYSHNASAFLLKALGK